MATNDSEFPERGRLWPGAILGAIVHAIAVTQYPEISNEQSWDGDNYNVQDSMGSRGTISFSGDDLVGVFFDDDSPRNPFNSEDDGDYDLEVFLEGMPDGLRQLARERALQYVLQDYEGAAQPIITAAFWSRGERLAAAEPWQEVFDNGAHLVRIQLMETEEAFDEWQEQYELSDEQMALARSVFERKMADPTAPLKLEGRELELLTSWAESEEGMKECRESFGEIGISLP
jgi:hypothetical protein